MPDKSVNIAVVGAGAIGAATAAFLAKAGWNTEIVCKHQEIADLAQSPGLHVFGVKGEHYVPVRGGQGYQGPQRTQGSGAAGHESDRLS